MGLKKYFIFSVILIVAVIGFAFSLDLGEYNITLFDYSVTLPTFVWVILPITLLALATYLHLMFYGLLNYLKQRAITKDYESMIKLIKSGLLEKNDEYKFKTTEFKNLASILSSLNIDVKDNRFSSVDEELNKIVGNIQDIKSGKFVNDKSFKANETSTLSNQNILNKVNEQVDFAVDVLKKPENFPNEVV